MQSLYFFAITQAFLCEKGIKFVRIDCTITGNDRQSAIQSFQSSKEVCLCYFLFNLWCYYVFRPFIVYLVISNLLLLLLLIFFKSFINFLCFLIVM